LQTIQPESPFGLPASGSAYTQPSSFCTESQASFRQPLSAPPAAKCTLPQETRIGEDCLPIGFHGTLALPKEIDNWSLKSLQQRLAKTGARLVKHAHRYWLPLAKSHLTRC
jgi:hypothetical protein